MTRTLLPESVARRIYDTLLERFGDPIGDMTGDGQGVPSSDKKKDMGNRGFGEKFEAQVCEGCGHMPEKISEGPCCDQCGMMQASMVQASMIEDEELDEKAPPGREKQVKALKKVPGIDNPWAVAWGSYNKRKKKR